MGLSPLFSFFGSRKLENNMTTKAHIGDTPRTPAVVPAMGESTLSQLSLASIEKELRQLNVNLAEANDIAMLSAFAAMPADLDNDSRKALRRLRDRMMARAVTRADS